MLTSFALLTLPLLILSTPTESAKYLTPRSPFKKLTPPPNRISIFNSCGEDFNLWSIPGTPDNAPIILPPNHVYMEEPHNGPAGGGISLKLTPSSSPTLAAPHTQFEYTVANNMIYYDISFIDCVAKNEATGEMSDGKECPGHAVGVQAVGGGTCETLTCEAGAFCESNAYFLPEGGYKPVSPVRSCGVAEGVAFELCAGARQTEI